MKRLTYRDPIDATDGSKYAAWLRELRTASGVYVIRARRGGEVLYVGESHTGQLYKTLTRHFQAWNLPGFSGRTYARGAVEVAARRCPPGSAIACQDGLVKRLKPRDNVAGAPPVADDYDWGAGDF